MINKKDNLVVKKGLWVLVMAAALIRLASLGAYPLTDTTEARYGEIARLMQKTGDWITPRLSPEVPFWGKPPLSFWLSALSMKLFGVNEFAARLPSWLLGLGVSLLLWGLAVRQGNRNDALISILILNTTVIFWISSGAAMTDHSLLAATTLCMVAFWRALAFPDGSNRLWGYVFFIGLAVGMLAKGPVAVVLTGLPVFGWTLMRWKWRKVWLRLPWIRGLALTAVLSIPWYWMAEIRTPGFLEYFFIGEHVMRFLVPGWDGDLYGTAHLRPRGMIWVFWLACAFPWPMVALMMFFKKPFQQSSLALIPRPDAWTLYLILWAISPMVFFTLSRNILAAYVLPGIPAFALLLARLWDGKNRNLMATTTRPIASTATVMIILFALALGVASAGYGVDEKSQKDLVAAFQKIRKDRNSQLVYLFKQPMSADFYSSGTAAAAATPRDAERFFGNGVMDYFAVRKSALEKIPPSFLDRLMDLGPIHRYYLLGEKTP